MTHISYTQADQQFLADVNAYIERYISKQVITLAMIADSLQMSHAAIRYKIRLLTGLSGSDYILKVRLQHSLHQMIHEHCNVSEAATENGFKDLSYFHNCFKDEYGMTPMEYLDRLPARDITNLKKTIKTMKQRLIAMLLSLPLAVSVIQAQPITAGQHTRVETVYGTIEGYQDGSIFTFKGIQYAKAAQGGAPAYLYLFTWKPASNALGASHGMELPFMLHNVSLQREMTGASPAAYKFEKLISSIWLSFIKTGNPNTKGLPRWEPYNEETGVTMILDNKCEPRQHHDRELMQMSRSIW